MIRRKKHTCLTNQWSLNGAVVLMVAVLLLLLPGGTMGSIPHVLVASPVWKTANYYYADVHVPKAFVAKKIHFSPSPQYCPDTGRTICKDVHHYPSDHIYDIVMATKYKHFNFSSVFFDERDGDSTPNADLLPSSPPPPHPETNYIIYHAAPVSIQEVPAHIGPSLSHPPHHHQHDPWNFAPPHSPTAIFYNQHKRSEFAGHYKGCFRAIKTTIIHESLSRRKRAPEDDNGGLIGDPACPARTMYVSPKAALSDRSQWKYVVNLQDRDPRVKQILRADVCRTQDSPCASEITLPFGYISRCRQKYLKKKLLSLDADGNGLSEENFFIPSCCVCEIVRQRR